MSVMRIESDGFNNLTGSMDSLSDISAKRHRVGKFVGKVADVLSIWPSSEHVGPSEHARVKVPGGGLEKREHNPLMPVPTFQHPEFAQPQQSPNNSPDFIPGSYGFSD